MVGIFCETREVGEIRCRFMFQPMAYFETNRAFEDAATLSSISRNAGRGGQRDVFDLCSPLRATFLPIGVNVFTPHPTSRHHRRASTVFTFTCTAQPKLSRSERRQRAPQILYFE